MKINVSVTLDINPADWTLAYGVEGAAEIRADVKNYVGGGVAAHFGDGCEIPAEVTWK